MIAASVGICTTPLRSLSFYEHLPGAPGLIEHWLEGYRTVRAVAKAEEEEIPTFVMLRRLLLVAWVGSHAETDLARSLGVAYTDQTVGLCSAYLKRSGEADQSSRTMILENPLG